MDIRERNLDSDTVDQLSLRKIDPSADIELQINKKGDRSMFVATISKELITYLAAIDHAKSNYKAYRQANHGPVLSYFFHKGLFVNMYTKYPEPMQLAADSKNRYRQMYDFLRHNMTYRESLNYLANDKGIFKDESEMSKWSIAEIQLRENSVKNLLLQGVFEGA